MSIADFALSKEEAERMIEATSYLVVITDLRLASSKINEGLDIISYVKKRHPNTSVADDDRLRQPRHPAGGL